MALIGYARTSTVDQKAGLEDQLRLLNEAKCDRIFSEHISGIEAHKPQLAECLSYIRDGDTLLVTKIDRLGRTTAGVVTLVTELKARGIHFRVLDPALDTSTAIGECILHIFAAFAQMERSIMLERQRAGIARAQREGKYKGKTPSLTQAQVLEARRMKAAGIPVRDLAAHYGIGVSTMYMYVDTRQGHTGKKGRLEAPKPAKPARVRPTIKEVLDSFKSDGDGGHG